LAAKMQMTTIRRDLQLNDRSEERWRKIVPLIYNILLEAGEGEAWSGTRNILHGRSAKVLLLDHRDPLV